MRRLPRTGSSIFGPGGRIAYRPRPVHTCVTCGKQHSEAEARATNGKCTVCAPELRCLSEDCGWSGTRAAAGDFGGRETHAPACPECEGEATDG